MACRVIYLAACILKKQEIQSVSDGTPYLMENLSKTRFEKLSYLRKVRPEAFAYIALAEKLLKKQQ